MGNQLNISQIFTDIKSHAISHTYDQFKQKIIHINQAFQHIHHQLNINLQLSPSTIRYETLNWKKSTVKGLISIQYQYLNKNNTQQYSLQQHKNSKKQLFQQNVLLSYQDVITLYEQLKNLHQFKTTPSSPKKQLRNSKKADSSKLEFIQQKNKPIQTPNCNLSQESDQCCICFQKAPSMVLPCSHAFCDNCTVKYIIQKQQKKCPQCRQQIKGSRQSVQRQIFTVIQDNQVFEQVRVDVLQVLKNLNPRIVKNIQQKLKNK